MTRRRPRRRGLFARTWSAASKHTFGSWRRAFRRLTKAADALIAAYLSGHKALFFGNGGSAADAQHLAAEFLGRYLREREPLPALALNTNTSAVTAIGNDYGYEQTFARQLRALGSPGDVAVGISTSGNSRNVLEALVCARELGLFTIALTGASGGQMREAGRCSY